MMVASNILSDKVVSFSPSDLKIRDKDELPSELKSRDKAKLPNEVLIDLTTIDDASKDNTASTSNPTELCIHLL